MRHILLLEDDTDTRLWFSELLHKAISDIIIVEAEGIRQALTLLTEYSLSMAIVDIYLPDGRGFEFIKKAKQINPGLFCVVVTAFDDDADIFLALQAGADGYLLKSQDKDTLVRSLQNIMEGAPPLSPSVARRIIKHFQVKEKALQESRIALTDREKEVLILISKGMTRLETANMLGIREGTVAGYIKRVYEKLNVSSRAQAALEAQRMGLI
jgi:DNA-binding NarL/FixJ family response regulator